MRGRRIAIGPYYPHLATKVPLTHTTQAATLACFEHDGLCKRKGGGGCRWFILSINYFFSRTKQKHKPPRCDRLFFWLFFAPPPPPPRVARGAPAARGPPRTPVVYAPRAPVHPPPPPPPRPSPPRSALCVHDVLSFPARFACDRPRVRTDTSEPWHRAQTRGRARGGAAPVPGHNFERHKKLVNPQNPKKA